MTVKAIYDYDFPAVDRAEVFGDDMLVNVWWRNNRLIATPACFRAPKAMSFADFTANVVDAWAATDPDYDPSAVTDWQVDDQAITPDDGAALADLVGHKGLLSFRTGLDPDGRG
jgi:phenol/toluene 2-monooxygenase (NADH) P4/A4